MLTIWATSGDRVLLLGYWLVPDAGKIFGKADSLARVVAALCEMGIFRAAEALWIPLGLVWAASLTVEALKAKHAICKLLVHSKRSQVRAKHTQVRVLRWNEHRRSGGEGHRGEANDGKTHAGGGGSQ